MRYLLARLIQGVFSVLAVSLITFAIPFLNSKPYSLAIANLGAKAKFYEIKAWIQNNGFNDPFFVQYWHWFYKAMHFNFGTAYSYSKLGQVVTVNTVLSGALWRSVWLVFIPTIFSILIAVPIGLSQAIKRNKAYDHGMTTVVYVLYSTPAFLVCTLISFYVGDDMKWLGLPPTINQVAKQVSPHQFPVWMLEHFNQFILPFIAIIILSVGGLTRFMRGSALDTLVQDHVRTARAKGGSPMRVLFRHVMRPSLIPLITIVGLTIPSIIGGAIIVEEVFNYPGMGVITVNAAEVGDFAIVMAVTIFTAFLTILGNYLADIFVAIADPRVRLGAAR
jgi:peptide/nickel transport system permease protein